MTDPCFSELRNYIEGPEQQNPCTVSVPKYVALTIETFLAEILQRIGKNSTDITPQDVIDLIRNIPEYSFLMPAIDLISQ